MENESSGKGSDRVVLRQDGKEDLESFRSSPSISEDEKLRLETYRSEAEGYRYRIGEDGGGNHIKDNGRSNQGISLWLEHNGHTSTRQSGLEHWTIKDEERGC